MPTAQPSFLLEAGKEIAHACERTHPMQFSAAIALTLLLEKVLFLQLGGLRQEPVQHLASVHARVALQLRKAEEVACCGERVTPAFEDLRDAVDESSFNVENDCCESIGHGCQAQPALEAKCACLVCVP